MGYEEFGKKLTEFIEYYYDAGYDVEADDSNLEVDNQFTISISNGDDSVLVILTVVSAYADMDRTTIHIDFQKPKNSGNAFVYEVMNTFARITGIPLYHVH